MRRAPLAGGLLALACAPAPDPGAPTGAADDWSVVVVVLDALPAGALGTYGRVVPGYEDVPVSPRIDAFAADAVVFEDAYASASYTQASTGSLFTGTSPATHGVLGPHGNVLAPQHRTLAETLAEAGFATAGLSCNPHVSRESGFDQGFDLYRQYFFYEQGAHTVPETYVDDAATWWRGRADERRFLYAHLLPPHQPYTPPAPDDTAFGADEVPVELGSTAFLVEASERRDLHADLPLMRDVRRRFDAGVRYADRQFGELLDALAGPDGDGLDDTVVVLLSDHGEGFAEHGAILHGGTVYPEMCRVPLVIAVPGLDGRREPGLVGTRDLGATLAELFDLAWTDPGTADKGSSFLPLLVDDEAGRAARGTRRVLSRSMGNRPVWALRDEAWTLIHHKASDGVELYDRTTDPGETRNLAEARPDEAAALLDELRRTLAADREAGRVYPRSVRERLAHREALDALGYFED